MYKIDPAHMQDIFVFAKDSFLESYSYFTEKEYDDMVTEFFKNNYTEKEVDDALPLSECSEPVKRAYIYTSPYHKNPLDDEWEDDE